MKVKEAALAAFSLAYIFRCLALLFTDKYFSGFSDANSKTKKEKIFFDNFFRLDKIDNRSVETYGLIYLSITHTQ